jgi:hypothetical protein
VPINWAQGQYKRKDDTMIRNLKATGLALAAVFAMSAMSASTASATDFFTNTLGAGKNALLTGTSMDHIIHIPSAGEFKCTKTTFVGTALHGSAELAVDPTYTGQINQTPHNEKHECTGPTGPATFDVNECEYILTGNTAGKDLEKMDALLWIVCPAGKAIQMTGQLGCTVSIPTQTPTIGGVTYANSPLHIGGAAIKVTITATGITFTATPGCSSIGIPTHGNNATYNGTVTLTGYEDKNGLPTPIEEGKQIGVSFS